MDQALLARYDRRVPRYTSYPTALQFHAGIGAERYAEWLRQIAPGTTASLYIHVPYCHSLCWYCGCNTKIVARYSPVADFIRRIVAEMDLVLAKLPGRIGAGHIHWGGGTPNILSPPDIQHLAYAMRGRFDFRKGAEFAVEIDPRLMDEPRAIALGRAGVTRASIGAQDFDPAVQDAVNRVQPYEMVDETVKMLREQGIAAINLDLMYGLPGQTLDGIKRNVDLALTLRPDRISLFGYAHVPWMKKHQRMMDANALPETAARWQMAETAAALLEAAGFVRIGLDHFARKTDPIVRLASERQLKRNFQGYTTDAAGTLLGFGPSAIGALAQGYVQNTTETRRWAEAIEQLRLPTARGVALTEQDRLRRDLIHRLMCDLAVDHAEVAAAHGFSPDHFAREAASLPAFAADGLIRLEGTRLEITPLGQPLMRTVAAVFDAYLTESTTRHAKAV